LWIVIRVTCQFTTSLPYFGRLHVVANAFVWRRGDPWCLARFVGPFYLLRGVGRPQSLARFVGPFYLLRGVGRPQSLARFVGPFYLLRGVGPWGVFRVFGLLCLVLVRRTHRENLTYKYIMIS
jgi:hypothetical protein